LRHKRLAHPPVELALVEHACRKRGLQRADHLLAVSV
jgi:hypothetical protein